MLLKLLKLLRSTTPGPFHIIIDAESEQQALQLLQQSEIKGNSIGYFVVNESGFIVADGSYTKT